MRGKVANPEKKPAEPRPWSIVAAASRLVTVAHAGLGEQVAGTSRVVFQLAAQPGHVKAEIVGALLEPGPPDHGQDLRRRHELAGPVEQDGQDAPFGGRQPERRPLRPPAPKTPPPPAPPPGPRPPAPRLPGGAVRSPSQWPMVTWCGRSRPSS